MRIRPSGVPSLRMARGSRNPAASRRADEDEDDARAEGVAEGEQGDGGDLSHGSGGMGFSAAQPLDELQVLVGGLPADVAGLGFFQQDLPVFGGRLEGFPALQVLAMRHHRMRSPPSKMTRIWYLTSSCLFLPADVLAHDGRTVAYGARGQSVMSSQPEAENQTGGFDPGAVRRQFAILNRDVAWLDNAATTQRPEAVLQAMDRFYRQHNANTRRSVHRLGTEATAAYEGARATVAKFLGAAAPEEIVFTAGTTAAINMVAAGLARWEIGPGDEVWVSALEHHSNWVPWQKAAQRDGRDAEGHSADAGRAAGSGCFPQGAGGAPDEVGGRGLGVERAGRGERRARDLRCRARVGGAGAGGWRARGGASAGGCGGDGLRFLRVFGAQDVRSDGHRGAVGAEGLAGADGAAALWRRDDRARGRPDGDLGGGAVPVRRRHAERGGRGGAGGGDRVGAGVAGGGA